MTFVWQKEISDDIGLKRFHGDRFYRGWSQAGFILQKCGYMLDTFKFIRSDKVSLRGGNGQVMHIHRFKMITELERLQKVYTGLIYCYWYVDDKLHQDVFHEDELEHAY